jgi:predicted SAM-dependent methyltransferase
VATEGPTTWAELLAIEPLLLNFGGKGDHHPKKEYRGWCAVGCGRVREHGANETSGCPWNLWAWFPTTLPLPDATVDRVLSEHMLEHIRSRFAGGIFSEIVRLLRPGGTCRIAVPDGNCPGYREYESRQTGQNALRHPALWNVGGLMEVMYGVGFDTVVPQQWFDAQGGYHHHPLDLSLGFIKRTLEQQYRTNTSVRYTTLVVDARKAGAS